MRIVQSSIVRALVAFAVGVLLVKFREDMMRWLTMVIGLLFTASGVISCVAYYVERRRIQKANAISPDMAEKPRLPFFPIVGVGSIILGIMLISMPSDFIIGVAYVLASMLILGVIGQYASLVRASRVFRIPIVFWIMPLAVLAVAIYILVSPMEATALPLRIIGWCLMLYAVIECVNAIRIHRGDRSITNHTTEQVDNE